MLRRFSMKYETPKCEIIKIDNVDIIRTSGFSDDDGGIGDVPAIDII